MNIQTKNWLKEALHTTNRFTIQKTLKKQQQRLQINIKAEHKLPCFSSLTTSSQTSPITTTRWPLPGLTAIWPNQQPPFELKFPPLVKWCVVGPSLSPVTPPCPHVTGCTPLCITVHVAWSAPSFPLSWIGD